jgi:hypothetical protein
VPGDPLPPKPPPAPPWTATDWLALIDKLVPFVDRYLALEEKKLAHERALEQAAAKSSWNVLAVLMTFLAVVVALMTWLTFAGKVSGDALLFLVGTAVGSILALVYRQLFPETIAAPEE